MTLKRLFDVAVGDPVFRFIGDFNTPMPLKVASVKVSKKPAEGAAPGSAPEFETKYYDSFLIPYYEGSIRKCPRRSTLEKARKLAKETATRLNIQLEEARGRGPSLGLAISAVAGGTCPWWQVNSREMSRHMSDQIEFLSEFSRNGL